MKSSLKTAAALASLATLIGSVPFVRAQESSLGSFTYQGRLNDANGPANGLFDFLFSLYPASTGTNNQVDTTITRQFVAVSNGLFAVKLAFPMANGSFDGTDRWLEIAVKPGGVPTNYTLLSPRQQITSAPYAIKAGAANLATTAYSVPGVRVNTNTFSTAFGRNTTASGDFSTAMGNFSTASGASATAMGTLSTASGGASVAAGSETTASGTFSVALGYQTTAGGAASMALGTQAKAPFNGSFVWADHQFTDFVSTSPNQFLIRASGGVGINTNNPNGAALAVGGNVNVEGVVSANALSAGSVTTPLVSASQVITPEVATTGNQSLLLRAGGGVGINNNNPNGASLAVGGNVNVEGVISANALSAGDVTTPQVNAGQVVTPRIAAPGLQPLEFTVNGERALRLEYASQPQTLGVSPNVVGGYSGNVISNGIIGGFIGGGGSLTDENSVGGDFASVVGGRGNVAIGPASTAMGSHNVTRGNCSTAIGWSSRANSDYSTAIGYFAQADGWISLAVGNGVAASGIASTAMGSSARANHNGAFVWSGFGHLENFASTAANQFLVRAGGGVGINTNNPNGAALAVNGTVRAVNHTTEGFEVGGTAAGYALHDRVTGEAGRWSMYASGSSLRFYSGGGDRMTINNNGAVSAQSFTPTSDRHAKENFRPVDARSVLDKVVSLPITEWNFKTAPGEAHLGPMAQDFHAAFGLGADDKHIATVDADGVALAAIQGLNQKLEERLEQKETEITKLKGEMAELKRLVGSLTQEFKSSKGEP